MKSRSELRTVRKLLIRALDQLLKQVNIFEAFDQNTPAWLWIPSGKHQESPEILTERGSTDKMLRPGGHNVPQPCTNRCEAYFRTRRFHLTPILHQKKPVVVTRILPFGKPPPDS